MTELDDDVRSILHGPTELRPVALDLEQIMKSGTRLRRRRSVARGAGALCMLALFVGAGTQLPGLLNHSDHLSRPAVASTPTITFTPGPVLRIKDNTSSGVKGAPLGDVIDTGLRTGEGGKEWVIYAVSGVKGDSYAFAIGIRQANDIITLDYLANETAGYVSTAPGFHPMQSDTLNEDGSIVPAFGYYVGRPAKITATYQGKPVTARLTPWSQNPAVTVFWFNTDVVNGNGRLQNLKALDATGNKLPQGHLVINIG